MHAKCMFKYEINVYIYITAILIGIFLNVLLVL